MQQQKRRIFTIFWIVFAVCLLFAGIYLLASFDGSLQAFAAQYFTAYYIGRVIAGGVFIFIVIVSLIVYGIKSPTPYAKIGHLSAGTVMIAGTVIVDQPIFARYSRRPCAFYRAFKYESRGQNRGVECTEQYQESASPLYIQDKSGKIALDTQNTDFFLKSIDKVGAYSGQAISAGQSEELLLAGTEVTVEGFYHLGKDGQKILTKGPSGEKVKLYTELEYGLSNDMSKIGKGMIALIVMTLFLIAYLLLADITPILGYKDQIKGLVVNLPLLGEIPALNGHFLLALAPLIKLDAYIVIGLAYLVIFSAGSYMLQLIALKLTFIKPLRWLLEIIAFTMMNSLVPMILVCFIFGIFDLNMYKAWYVLLFSYPFIALYNLCFIPRLSRENEAYLERHHASMR